MEERFEIAYRLMLSELMPLLLHELNNPLTAITAVPDLLASAGGAAPSQDLLETLQSSIETIGDCIESAHRILQAPMRPGYAHLSPTLMLLLQVCAPQIRRARLQVKPEIPRTLPSVEMSQRELTLVLYCGIRGCTEVAQQADIAAVKPHALQVIASRGEEEVQLVYSMPQAVARALPQETVSQLQGAPLSSPQFLRGDVVLEQIFAAQRRLEETHRIESRWQADAEQVALRFHFAGAQGEENR